MIWLTEIQATDPQTGEMCLWCGPRIEADTEEEATQYCNENGLGYCKVIGKLIEELPQKEFEVCPN